MTSSGSWHRPRSDSSCCRQSTPVQWVGPRGAFAPRHAEAESASLMQLLETNDSCLSRWRWTCRGRAAFPSKDQEEACLWCITAPECTHCLTATRGEWRTVRSVQCRKNLQWNRRLSEFDKDCFFVGVYPEIPEGSQLDFSALKEEVRLFFFFLNAHLCCLEINTTMFWLTGRVAPAVQLPDTLLRAAGPIGTGLRWWRGRGQSQYQDWTGRARHVLWSIIINHTVPY